MHNRKIDLATIRCDLSNYILDTNKTRQLLEQIQNPSLRFLLISLQSKSMGLLCVISEILEKAEELENDTEINNLVADEINVLRQNRIL